MWSRPVPGGPRKSIRGRNILTRRTQSDLRIHPTFGGLLFPVQNEVETTKVEMTVYIRSTRRVRSINK